MFYYFLSYFWGSHISASHWNSRLFFFLLLFKNFLLQQQVPEQTNKRICNGALKRCRELYERLASDGSIMVYLEGSQTNSLFDNCKEIQVVTVLQHRNTRGLYLWLAMSCKYKVLHNFKGFSCFRRCVMSLNLIVLIFINMCANCIICKENES